MNETACYIGLFLFLPATLLLLAAGLGWKSQASALSLAFAIATVAAIAGAFFLMLLVPTLAAAPFGFIGGFIVGTIGAAIWLAKSKRFAAESSARSPEFLGAAGVACAFVLFCLFYLFVNSTPSAASTQRLVQRVDNSIYTPESLSEIVRRGPESVPFILTVLHRYPYAQKDDHTTRGSVHVAPQLELLSQIGGTEAIAELHRWADADSWAQAKAAALCGLAANGDPDAAKRIGDFLGTNKNTYGYSEAKLFRALGKLKAADQVGVIHARLDKLLKSHTLFNEQDTKRYSVRQLTKDGFLGTHAYMQAGIIALGDIDTENAWVTLEKFHNNPDIKRRALITTMLEDCPGTYAVTLLAKALDDPEPLVRECAYVALWHREPALQLKLEEKWNASNEQTMREAMKP